VPGTKKLVIVESPAKAKTIAQYLGDGYEVQASVGHIRDLVEPKNLPAELKKGSLGKFSVDVENGFEPYYVVSDAKKKTVADLKRALKDADELYLATDEDREGEAIAWHLLQVLKPKVPVHRMVFHEITKEAIQRAKDATRDLDTALVDAQETRRILDRLYGYEVSPVLWRKVGPGLSAGRVQSAATRLVVDRERERLAFVSVNYWDLTAKLAKGDEAFQARLARLGGTRVASGRDFDDRGVATSDAVRLDEASASALSSVLERAGGAVVRSVESKPYTRRPVHDVDPAAGGSSQAPVLGSADDVDRTVAVRERPHHLHANRLVVAVAAGDHRGPQAGLRALRPRDHPRQAAVLRGQEQERARGPRGDPPRR
jgi:DNA topoisomerase I